MGVVVESHGGTQDGLGKGFVNVGQLTNTHNFSGMPPKENADIENAGESQADQITLGRGREALTTSLPKLDTRTSTYHEYQFEYVNERSVTNEGKVHLDLDFDPKPTHPNENL